MVSLYDGHSSEALIKEREEACEKVPHNVTESQVPLCPKEFDGWTCISATPAGHVAQFPCPYFIYGFDPKRLAQRICLDDGSWFRHPDSNKTWSNYTTCIDLDDYKLRNQVNLIYKSGYCVSIVALTVSIVIFFYFKSLTCTRIQIHKNLFISLAVNNILWLLWYEAVVDNLPVLMANGLGCQILHIMVQYFLVATYFWMFCEGVYLYTLLVVTFMTESLVMPILYIIGWGVPAVLVTLYAFFRSSLREETIHCWINESLYSWTLSGPVCASMIANLIFLINIVRLLLTKLPAAQIQSPQCSVKERSASFRFRMSRRNTVSGAPGVPSGRFKKAVRATFILIPLLGLQYIVMPFRPEQGNAWEPTYQIISALVTSCQPIEAFLHTEKNSSPGSRTFGLYKHTAHIPGSEARSSRRSNRINRSYGSSARYIWLLSPERRGLCVALLFCFCNGEVTTAIAKKWRQCHISKKKPWQSCSAVTTVSRREREYEQKKGNNFHTELSRSSVVHEMGGAQALETFNQMHHSKSGARGRKEKHMQKDVLPLQNLQNIQL